MYNYIDVHIGKSIRALREEQRLSVAAFASGINVSPADLEDYEAGKARLPAKTMMEAAILLNVDASVFFTGLPISRPANVAYPEAAARAPAARSGTAPRG